MEYDKSIPFDGDPERVLRSLVLTFSHLGFRVERKEASRVELVGVGMHNSRESPLVGISRLHVAAEGGTLRVSAEFGAVRRLLRFTTWFIVGLAVFLLVLFGFLFRNRDNFSLWLVVLPFAPWPLLIPVLSRILVARTRRALDNLIHNAAVLGGD